MVFLDIVFVVILWEEGGECINIERISHTINNKHMFDVIWYS